LKIFNQRRRRRRLTLLAGAGTPSGQAGNHSGRRSSPLADSQLLYLVVCRRAVLSGAVRFGAGAGVRRRRRRLRGGA
jgi:hypothetical protein